MNADFGNLAILAALVLSLAQLFSRKQFYKKTSLLIFLSILYALATLIYANIVSDFSVLNVFKYSHTSKPLLYKITGSWGNHEGSMLLLTLIFSAYNLGLAFCNIRNDKLKRYALRNHTFILICFLVFVYFLSNPLTVVSPIPENGLGLNPLLQDIGLAIHPPILYIGYAGFSATFSVALGMLLTDETNKIALQHLRRFTIIALSFLTLGIGIGSWWAYRELGWGGFWFWDPVENVSLLPWLIGLALFHSIILTQKRDNIYNWTKLLAIIAFILSLIGIFLVRSGILTSVHSFTQDPKRGMYILVFIFVITVYSLLIFGFKAKTRSHKIHIFSRDGSIILNNYLLVVLTSIVLIGTIYPLLTEFFLNKSISVNAPYFNSTFNPLVIPLVALAIIGPMLKWYTDKYKNLIKKLLLPVLLSAIGFLLFDYIYPNTFNVISSLGIFFSLFIIFGMITLTTKYINFKQNLKHEIKKLPKNFHAMFISHIGLAILVLAISLVTSLQIEHEAVIAPGTTTKVGSFEAKFESTKDIKGSNFIAKEGTFLIFKNHEQLAELKPQLRLYPVEESTTIEADIYYGVLDNFYIAIGDTDLHNNFAVRFYHKPYINLIWLACFMIALGIILTFRGQRILK